MAAASSGVRRSSRTRPIIGPDGAGSAHHRLPERLLRGRPTGGPHRRRDRSASLRPDRVGRVRPRGRDARLASRRPRVVPGPGRPVAAPLRTGERGRRAAPLGRPLEDRRRRERRLRAASRGLLRLRGDRAGEAAARPRRGRADGGRPRHRLLRPRDLARGARSGFPRDGRPRGNPRHRRTARRLRPRPRGAARGGGDDQVIDRVLESMFHLWRIVGAASPGARRIERDGVLAAVVPAAPERAVINSVLYRDVRGLEAAYDELDWTADGDFVHVGPINDASYPFGTDSFSRALVCLPEDSGAHVYLARVDGEPAGCLLMIDHDGTSEVQMVAVRPEARGTGLSGRLLAHALADAAKRGARSSTLIATRLGRPVYERAGFRVLGRFEMWEVGPRPS